MNTCPYCGSAVNHIQNSNNAKCNFCDIILGEKSPYGMFVNNGQRLKRDRKYNVTLEMVESSLPVLLTLHTIELIILLSMAREQRTMVFGLLRTFNNAIQNDVKGYEEVAKEQGEEYDKWTRYCWRIENILLHRIGYYPQKITNELVLAYEKKCDNPKIKDMKISKQKRVLK